MKKINIKQFGSITQEDFDFMIKIEEQFENDHPKCFSDIQTMRLCKIIRKLIKENNELYAYRLKELFVLGNLEKKTMDVIDVLEDAKVGMIKILLDEDSNFTDARGKEYEDPVLIQLNKECRLKPF